MTAVSSTSWRVMCLLKPCVNVYTPDYGMYCHRAALSTGISCTYHHRFKHVSKRRRYCALPVLVDYSAVEAWVSQKLVMDGLQLSPSRFRWTRGAMHPPQLTTIMQRRNQNALQ